MATDDNVVEAIAFGSTQAIGHFHYDTVTDGWTWDDEVYRMHGYQPGEVAVDADLVTRHAYEDDRAEAARVIEESLFHGEPFSCYHRVVTKDGAVRNVVMVGAGVMDESREVVALDGFYIDLTPDVRRQEGEAAHQAVQESTEHRAAIEQAKGMIMLTYSINADAAFAMLRWWSMQRNLKVNLLAERLVAAGTQQQLTNPEVAVRVDRLLEDITTSPDV